ncbi:aminomethyl-transferring glycine dehydrogenase [Synechococcus sp. Cruz-9H2]|nr:MULTISPECIES: aminomethyl-transferring glycine dehydrogenase [unclassified Synechococcus]MCP9820852.1 aminomethyl-transferring glycine dehydrogenase [Synechococcus sp. Cruz-9H2]MCP9845076.1 aminomethyl-transferring glycine dehydrogenase [Synechococcus sp. Edmonson 11F2]MCP9857208.1 aminomethyl-transferring glycine dehydrogenase [Synechococcus sp. Cruz-9C9]MCP9864493.1 aminomethyl-transferring glycine dehydrogenase [Synechococcus sp. Cruz-7E5]MCP9871762.1 aminomethyl-transferring glycine deh
MAGLPRDVSPFLQRHLGPSTAEQARMLERLGCADLEGFVAEVVPGDILIPAAAAEQGLPTGVGEAEALTELRRIASLNKVRRSLIGLGYYGTATPALIQRHVLENPCWYTAYTPYQAEIAQGRLEALLNFQTLISELTALPIANASLLDEATAAAEAMALSAGACRRSQARRFLVDEQVFPQTLEVLRTRAEPLGILIETFDPARVGAVTAAGCEQPVADDVFGVLLQLPGSRGQLFDPTTVIEAAHRAGAMVTVAIDPMAQVLLAPVGALGADIAIGSSQRFGVPLGYGGPHAAFFATSEAHKRQIPGRLVGRSLDAEGRPALRLALQTREQHIRRDKATSNICTAQVLLAVMAGFYAVHHGPEGLTSIASRVLRLRAALALGLVRLGFQLDAGPAFGTISVVTADAAALLVRAEAAGFNLRPLVSQGGSLEGVALSLDERSDAAELDQLLGLFAAGSSQGEGAAAAISSAEVLLAELPADQELLAGLPLRQGPWLRQEVFQRYRSESELLRYIQRLASRDLSLVHGMIPLGSCTMKLNAAAELAPVSWSEFADLHPLVPPAQARGYARLIADLESWLATITGFAGVSLQPNAGSQGEYAGLLVIRAWHRSRGEDHRDICLIPTSAHGTNPASAVMAGLRVVPVSCDAQGNIDLEDLEAKAQTHAASLAAVMVTYPSTHGVFEPGIRRLCDVIHRHGGQVYLDGANLNAQVGLAKPGLYGADVCHLNLHKTFCIPHGGGGPGVGPIGVAAHLVPFLPGQAQGIGAVAAARWGSAGILPISWMYIRMMGGAGLRQASAVALLAANVIAERLQPHYPVLFRGPGGRVAHECILDLRPLKRSAGVEVDDLAKRLMDYGFHAPTVSWPVAGTVMVEPTESESLEEIDRFCEALIAIRSEVAAIEAGQVDPLDNPLKRAPHTLGAVTADDWDRPYSRQQAAFPAGDTQRDNKFWPAVARIDNAYGDRHLVCTCPSVEELAAALPIQALADEGTTAPVTTAPVLAGQGR